MSAYSKLEERIPAYEERDPNDEVNLEVQMVPLAPHTEMNITNINIAYFREIHACCIVISVLNFLCCAWCGIPAVIFTILGIEADTRRDKAFAQRHRLYMFIFNIVGCILFWIFLVAQVIFYGAYGVVIQALIASDNEQN